MSPTFGSDFQHVYVHKRKDYYQVRDRFLRAFSFAKVYSCSEQFDLTLISNYDLLGVEEVVSFCHVSW